jgi:ribonuclease III
VSTPHREPDLGVLSARIGYRFADGGLLRQALAHRSWCAEVAGETSNERLEFLGDAVLGWVIADLAYQRFHELPEGKLTDLRKSVVNAHALAGVARTIGLGECLLLGKGEDAAGGRDKASILSDAFEAVLGAVYVDGGVDPVGHLVDRLFGDLLVEAARSLDRLDYKTLLQELTARLFDVAPVYVVSSSGPDHDKRFEAAVWVDGTQRGTGTGTSKKAAEQAAAGQAHDALRAAPPPERNDAGTA